MQHLSRRSGLPPFGISDCGLVEKKSNAPLDPKAARLYL